MLANHSHSGRRRSNSGVALIGLVAMLFGAALVVVALVTPGGGNEVLLTAATGAVSVIAGWLLQLAYGGSRN